MSEEVSGSKNGNGPLIVAVEGNIGSGKSTFLSFCSADESFEVLPEPVNKWVDVGGVNLLEKFYEDPVKWGFIFQMEVNVSMLGHYLQDCAKPIKLVERSLLSSRYCFQKSMATNAILGSAMDSVLNHFHDCVATNWKTRPHAIVYLQTSPSVAYHRLKTRCRAEESAVSYSYLVEIDRLHNEWLGNLQHLNMTVFFIDFYTRLGYLKVITIKDKKLPDYGFTRNVKLSRKSEFFKLYS